MRRYTDPRGREWDVVVGRESFGALYALFVPAAETRAETRQTLLEADSQVEARKGVERMTDTEMNELFERSEPKRL
ncbi:MAG: hypothetical protein GWM90_25265 [Gemmatimonadetes bacterium]|nr:hypothetical protein [Gemmatimonadota bacterium]NIQ58110.1 hypothetical protein [Gemmatimonadota bacterium]NIU78312.1 hypothetical protein [Gammaproteobacteria bacterium]NIX47266.1 hypothetical protein [Gemmatimonadota bacterium]NIY11643.1 hypothetical protein [Gemmatimonadota bacterium]